MALPSAMDAGWTRASRAAAFMRLARRWAPYAVLLVASGILLATSPTDGDFSWSDAPRHALNGAFVKDFVASLPWRHPVAWAENYYLQYPALSILFYPPLFYFFEAAVYAVFGVSHLASQATVAAFYAFLGLGVYRLARLWLPRFTALGAALMLMGAPEVALWGRQVMLDIPAMAWLVWGVWACAKFMRAGRGADLAFGAAMLLAALYTKYDVVFIAPVVMLTLVAARGVGILRDRRVLWTGWAAAIGALPAVYLALEFGMANFQSVDDLAGELPRWSLAAWQFYPDLLPQILGWPVLALALAGAGLLLAGRLPAFKSSGTGNWPAWLLLGWIALGYVFFSAIAVREPRHILTVMPPFAILAASVLDRLLSRRSAGLAACLIGICMLAWSVFECPVPVVTGYQELADYVAGHAPPNEVVLFSGYRDGNFIFDLRAREDRRDISTLRADKLLLRVAIERRRGVGDNGYSEDEIKRMIRGLGVSLVVAQDGFWNDLAEMRRFENVLANPDFIVVAHFPIGGTMGRIDKSFTVYRPAYPVESGKTDLGIDMPIIGGKFQGQIR